MPDKDFGDFEEVRDVEDSQNSEESQAPTRIKMPRGKEILGVVKQRLGGNRMEIQSTDGKTRNCRVPGRFKRKFWLRPRDVVLIEPWEHDDGKGDIVFQYQKNAANQIRKKGLLDSVSDEF
jgi:translation initiation factor 1A